MPYNLDIPGQVSEAELRSIEAVASLVPPNGLVVEVGSLFGRSSWAWAKSIDQTAEVVCIDPWAKNAGIRPMEEQLGIKYNLETFKKYTNDCNNIRTIQGYSPANFLDWNEQIDAYYDDAVHNDPIFSENLEFWSGHLKPSGILCGDDFRPRFPDIINGAERFASSMGRELIVVDFFWCLLPAIDLVPAAHHVADRLHAIAAEQRKIEIGIGPKISVVMDGIEHGLTRGAISDVGIKITNLRREAWPNDIDSDDQNICLIAKVDTPDNGDIVVEQKTDLDIGCLEFDIPHLAKIELRTDQLAPGTHEVRLDLCSIDRHSNAVEVVGRGRFDIEIGETSENRVIDERFESLSDPNFFLQYCDAKTADDTIGITQVRHQEYEFSTKAGPVTARSMLLIYELALLYALAKHHYSNQGKIVDAGCLVGASTFAFASGIAQNKTIINPEELIYSFDSEKE